MKLGLQLPQGADTARARDLAAIARRAEDIGYSSLWAYERVLFPAQPADGMYGVPGLLPWDPYYEHCADPLTVLTLAAAHTDRVRLGTCVLVAPLHGSLHLARALATLDVATGGGRVVAGLGAGWSTDEYRAAGVDFATRRRATDEMADALRALWGPNPVTYRDSTIDITDAAVNPKPAGPIPIVFGGATEPAFRRVAKRGDGWMAVGITGDTLAAGHRRITDLAEAEGRDPAALSLLLVAIVYLSPTPAGPTRMPFQGNLDQVLDDLSAAAKAGADEVILSIDRGPERATGFGDRAEELYEAARSAGLLLR
ncbi:LLM class F420-dependent oxidoreductase [Nocardia terpenica]|uniref:LLM class F420-dependent oxidoreductase n=1 Tax=Nocardia terpenica TaxID=455432 RepID=UPI0018954336|nr:LLM class F420-dependent oxidoreductase [Nocardia terpenica]MBF6065454.1 LLM class F420-dependent oxidoreductase [Nocardia terpenica]MBF6109136.1 LLM class F420-dependent oxidoreductase [Nocardia terpenica]MBF6114662.1 LLM class F420-dependent oxidoreductase [Nocardia terpenica]MBF6123347.1 LLM class F420-dependent oxidoreductase [Nocardia terpenica]MBF6156635.1 LLM class F420-dependent oxidoreductase [Nocardia terpenica]